jgi:prolyl oligopeptidase
LPEREAFARKMRNLVDYERTGVPVVRGGKAFYRWNAGLMNQWQLLADGDASADARAR